MNKNEVAKSTSGIAIIQVLAGLIDNPLLFSDNNYRFSINDFPEQFHQILFGAVDHLAHKGMKKIGYIDIDQFLREYPTQYKIFVDNHGVDYIQQALKIYDSKKFSYYYELLKKYSLLNCFNAQGFDTTDIYNPEEIDPGKINKQREAFDNMSVNDIILKEELKIIQAKEEFGSSDDMVQSHMGDNIEELIDELKKTPEMGMPLMSKKLTTIYRGQRKGCVYMTSAPTGMGKTRIMVGEAINLGVPEWYDSTKKKWIHTGRQERVLLIETELELQEIQTMVLANIAGVPETHILDGRYSGDEEERVRKAAQLVKQSGLYMVAITNYDTDDLINTIKKYYQLENVQYVFYDYLSENLKIMAEGARKSKVSGLRTDQILLSMITALKDCAKQLNIHIATATQLSGDFKNSKELDSSFLRSAKSLSDKVDVGSILMPVREVDRQVIAQYAQKGFEIEPNFVISVYKIRRGSYQNIKVYIYFDRSTCRIEDCFVTDKNGAILPVQDTNVDVMLDQTTEDKIENAYDFEF